jgi:hypothetical protein
LRQLDHQIKVVRQKLTMYCRDDFVLSVHDAIEKDMMNDYAIYA